MVATFSTTVDWSNGRCRAINHHFVLTVIAHISWCSTLPLGGVNIDARH